MIKTLIAADRSERERFRIPRSVQQSIPIQKIYRDGIWQTGGQVQPHMALRRHQLCTGLP